MMARKLYTGKNIEYIQNRTNWCWAVACKIAGEQYKKNHTEFSFNLGNGNTEVCSDIQQHRESVVATNNLEGLRTEIVKNRDGIYFVDAWQQAIAMQANSLHRGMDGNFPGDDMAKLRGLKYVITGECDSDLIRTVSVGRYDSECSFLCDYHRQLKLVFDKNEYLIGNAVLYPQMISHSFVLLEWGQNDQITVYDPWDGSVRNHTVQDVFLKGFQSAQGKGIIKWAQYIT